MRHSWHCWLWFHILWCLKLCLSRSRSVLQVSQEAFRFASEALSWSGTGTCAFTFSLCIFQQKMSHESQAKPVKMTAKKRCNKVTNTNYYFILLSLSSQLQHIWSKLLPSSYLVRQQPSEKGATRKSIVEFQSHKKSHYSHFGLNSTRRTRNP